MLAEHVACAVVFTGLAVLTWLSPLLFPIAHLGSPGEVFTWVFVGGLFSFGGIYNVARCFGAR